MIRRFTYPNYGTPCGFPEHKRLSGQDCKVTKEIKERDDEVERMFLVLFQDGTELQVFESELGRI